MARYLPTESASSLDVAVHLNGVTRRAGAVQEPSPGGLDHVTIVAKGPDGRPRTTAAELGAARVALRGPIRLHADDL